MHPVICAIGPFTVYSYGLMLAIAFSVSSALAVLEAKKKDISSDIIFNLTFIVFVSGVIGARLFFVGQNIGFYRKDPIEILMLQHGGLSWFGGLMLGSLSGISYLKSKKLPVYKILDLIIPFVVLGQAIGRIGCFLNGCCYGRGPVQLYSSMLLILIFAALRFLQDRPHASGQIFYAYLLLYSIKRFFIEFLRLDNPVIFLGLTLFQVLCIPLFCLAAVKLILIVIRRARPH